MTLHHATPEPTLHLQPETDDAPVPHPRSRSAPELPIYLDYSATTPVDPRVAQAMSTYLTEKFGNPASASHIYGWQAKSAVEQARRHVAALIGAQPAQIVWTSGATESNNLALKGAAHALAAAGRGRHLITLKTEHKSVLDPLRDLARQGFEVTELDPQDNGLVDLGTFESALRPDTILVSIMAVNNEIGVIQPLAALGAICHAHHIVFHVDAAQATGKIAIDLATLPVDLMSFSAHKTYGPKGIGALYLRNAAQLDLRAQIHGGGHENGLRAGTLPSHQIVGMGEAFRIAREEFDAEQLRVGQLRDLFWEGVRDLPGLRLNGDRQRRVPHNVNLSVDGIPGLNLGQGLNGLAVSSGSACNSACAAPSYVLQAIGCSEAQARNAVRLSWGRFTTRAHIEQAVQVFRQHWKRHT